MTGAGEGGRGMAAGESLEVCGHSVCFFVCFLGGGVGFFFFFFFFFGFLNNDDKC